MPFFGTETVVRLIANKTLFWHPVHLQPEHEWIGPRGLYVHIEQIQLLPTKFASPDKRGIIPLFDLSANLAGIEGVPLPKDTTVEICPLADQGKRPVDGPQDFGIRVRTDIPVAPGGGIFARDDSAPEPFFSDAAHIPHEQRQPIAVIVTTRERVQLPTGYGAFVYPLPFAAEIGLGFQAEPIGSAAEPAPMRILLTNLGLNAIALRPGMPIGEVLFYPVEGAQRVPHPIQYRYLGGTPQLPDPTEYFDNDMPDDIRRKGD